MQKFNESLAGGMAVTYSHAEDILNEDGPGVLSSLVGIAIFFPRLVPKAEGLPASL